MPRRSAPSPPHGAPSYQPQPPAHRAGKLCRAGCIEPLRALTHCRLRDVLQLSRRLIYLPNLQRETAAGRIFLPRIFLPVNISLQLDWHGDPPRIQAEKSVAEKWLIGVSLTAHMLELQLQTHNEKLLSHLIRVLSVFQPWLLESLVARHAALRRARTFGTLFQRR